MKLILNPKEDRRVKRGHCWIFSNEIKSVDINAKPGDLVSVYSSDDRFIGCGLYNPNSLISIRIVSNTNTELDSNWFKNKIAEALKFRLDLFSIGNSFRLIHGESDGVPGVIVDKYDKILSVQISSLGMELRKEILFDELMKIEGIEGIVERGDSNSRFLEGLPIVVGVVRGNVGIQIVSDGYINYLVDALGGQKTGFYLDQRESRIVLRKFSNNKNVLDLFSNSGGFSLHSKQSGAIKVIAVESSESTCNEFKKNIELNNLKGLSIRCNDVFSELNSIQNSNEKFDLVIADPPPFAKSKKHESAARKKYVQLFISCMNVTIKNGVNFYSTCSHNITRDTFFEMIREASFKAKREIVILEERGASYDHPILASMPETSYLRSAILLIK
ncbi:MAG: class I SAM-dependent rRNA methyltransferase [Chlorobiota bacterium]|nr:class I SAM-dependent rRNA methyltransferase [Chlorobiota bacterium]QQS67684.1 MAG: class I SAM-dependent rRNA methyltransferase [Chlorobiota bacterium]